MTKVLKGALVALALVGFTGCVSTSDILVDNTQSDKVDLKGYKTYQFIEGSGVAEDKDTKKMMDSTKTAARIEVLINQELMKKGKKPVSSNPDFFVAYLGGADMEAVKTKLDKKGKETIEKTPEAVLVLMLIDADTGGIIWMSTAEGEMKDLPLEDRRKRLEFAVKKMLDGV